MKCPKCRSENIVKDIYDGFFDIVQPYYCYDCLYKLTEKECKEYEYQARLDKVLSKMKGYKRIKNHKFLYVGDSKISIEFNNGRFYLEDRDERQIQISLETVESLIKDLEEENE